MKITDEDKDKLIKVIELRSSESSEDKTMNSEIETPEFDSSNSQSSSPKIQFGCQDNCCKSKSVNILTKQEEQEELFIDLISKVKNPELKSKYLKKLRKVISQEEPIQSTSQKISLNTTLEKFNKKKEVTLQDLQSKVKVVKKENFELKQISQKLQVENYEIKQRFA